MNLVISFLLLAVLPPQQTFNRFVYCREFPSGVFEKQCLDRNPMVRAKAVSSVEVLQKLPQY